MRSQLRFKNFVPASRQRLERVGEAFGRVPAGRHRGARCRKIQFQNFWRRVREKTPLVCGASFLLRPGCAPGTTTGACATGSATCIHVVYTDIQMPGSMDGLKLARFVRDRWPPIKIVATSGRVMVREDDLPAGSVFLPKPYRSAEVVETLRDITGAA
jgi:CheY-like chemotaxis protein